MIENIKGCCILSSLFIVPWLLMMVGIIIHAHFDPPPRWQLVTVIEETTGEGFYILEYELSDGGVHFGQVTASHASETIGCMLGGGLPSFKSLQAVIKPKDKIYIKQTNRYHEGVPLIMVELLE